MEGRKSHYHNKQYHKNSQKQICYVHLCLVMIVQRVPQKYNVATTGRVLHNFHTHQSLPARLTDTTGQQRAAEVFSFLWRHSYDDFLSPRQLLLVSDVWPPSPTQLQAGIRTTNCFFHVFEQSPASSLLLYTFQSRTKPVPFGFLASRSV